MRLRADETDRHLHTADLSARGCRGLLDTSGHPAPTHADRWADGVERLADAGGAAGPDAMAGAELHAIAQSALDAMRQAHTGQVSGRVSVRAVHQRVLIIDADGRQAEDERRYWSIRIDAVARSGAKVRRCRRMYGASSPTSSCTTGAIAASAPRR